MSAAPDLAAPPNAAAKLGGLRKAAVFLVAVGEDRAAEVFKHLSRRDRGALARDGEVAEGPAPRSAPAVIEEAVESVLAEGYLAEGGVDYAREVLERSLGPSARREIIGRLSATIERRPFEFLRRTPPEQIHVFLRTSRRRRSRS